MSRKYARRELDALPDEPAPDQVEEAVVMLRTLFSVEQITAALHQRMLEAAATERYYPVTTCDEDGHREEAEDLHARVLALQFGRAVAEPLPSRKAADELLDAVEQAIAERALPVTVQNRLKAAFNEVVDQANKTTLAKHGLVFEDSDAGQTCICEYDKPSRIMVGCPIHYPDPGADAEGEMA